MRCQRSTSDELKHSIEAVSQNLECKFKEAGAVSDHNHRWGQRLQPNPRRLEACSERCEQKHACENCAKVQSEEPQASSQKYQHRTVLKLSYGHIDQYIFNYWCNDSSNIRCAWSYITEQRFIGFSWPLQRHKDAEKRIQRDPTPTNNWRSPRRANYKAPGNLTTQAPRARPNAGTWRSPHGSYNCKHESSTEINLFLSKPGGTVESWIHPRYYWY